MKNRKGFSLVEVLVFVTVLGLFFVAAMSVTTYNLKNMKVQEHKILATRYSEEVTEWLRQNKEDDWTIFIGHDSGSGTNYCLNSLDWNSPGNCDNSYPVGSPPFFKRDLLLTNSGSPVDQVKAVLTISWKEGVSTLNVKNTTVFKILE